MAKAHRGLLGGKHYNVLTRTRTLILTHTNANTNPKPDPNPNPNPHPHPNPNPHLQEQHHDVELGLELLPLPVRAHLPNAEEAGGVVQRVLQLQLMAQVAHERLAGDLTRHAHPPGGTAGYTLSRFEGVRKKWIHFLSTEKCILDRDTKFS